MPSVLNRLYRTKLALSCVVLVAAGALLITASRLVASNPAWRWATALPLSEMGGTLVAGGILGVALDRFLKRESEEIDERRLRDLLTEQAPLMRDAVLEAFAANHKDLARVATPQMLDQIATNSLGLRLGDPEFAAEIYEDIRAQVVGASERWHDAHLSIGLSPSTGGRKDQFVVTVRWEYTVIPKHPQRRFVCLSDRQEYAEVASERGATSAWYLKPGPGVDATRTEAFELLAFSVDGAVRPIRRAVLKRGQSYTANVGAAAVEAGKPVTISYTYRTRTSRAGHLLFFDIEQPTRGLRVELNYGGCGISSVSALDLIPSVRATRIERTPAAVPGPAVRVDVDGWVFPRSGIAFVWTLESEITRRTTSRTPVRSHAN